MKKTMPIPHHPHLGETPSLDAKFKTEKSVQKSFAKPGIALTPVPQAIRCSNR
jgi:hypothetical protein